MDSTKSGGASDDETGTCYVSCSVTNALEANTMQSLSPTRAMVKSALPPHLVA